MNIQQLMDLNAIVTEGSFRAASKKIHKTQPAISKMIKNLEDEIGFSLLSRDAYRPHLTPKGKIFYEQAIKVLNEFSILGDIGSDFSTSYEAELKIVVNSIFPIENILISLKSPWNIAVKYHRGSGCVMQ